MPRFSPTMVHRVLVAALVLLFVGLLALPFLRSVQQPEHNSTAIQITCAALMLVFGAGGYWTLRGKSRPWPRIVWLGVLSVLWLYLLWLTPEGAWVVFPLFFLYLSLLRPLPGTVAVMASAVLTGVVLQVGNDGGFASFSGPLVGAAFAIVVGLGYRALRREAEEREALIERLAEALDERDAAEREAGALAERERLGRELHDTVAQGLSSIQMLLHAAEHSAPERPGVEHIRLARETAATNLAETRRFIEKLLPRSLEQHGLRQTLCRLSEGEWAQHGLDVQVVVDEGKDLPMHVQAALLRIAQGAIANVIQHARASHATITLLRTGDEVTYVISDDGVGFSTTDQVTDPSRRSSFGLQSIRERVEQLGGTLEIRSETGSGTELTVTLNLESANDSSPTR